MKQQQRNTLRRLTWVRHNSDIVDAMMNGALFEEKVRALIHMVKVPETEDKMENLYFEDSGHKM